MNMELYISLLASLVLAVALVLCVGDEISWWPAVSTRRARSTRPTAPLPSGPFSFPHRRQPSVTRARRLGPAPLPRPPRKETRPHLHSPPRLDPLDRGLQPIPNTYRSLQPRQDTHWLAPLPQCQAPHGPRPRRKDGHSPTL